MQDLRGQDPITETDLTMIPVSEWSYEELQGYVTTYDLERTLPEAMSPQEREVVKAWGEIAARRRSNAEQQAKRAAAQDVLEAVTKEKKRQAVVSFLNQRLTQAGNLFRMGQASIDDDFTLTIEQGGVAVRLSLIEMLQVTKNTGGNYALLVKQMSEALTMRHKTSDRECQNLCALGPVRYPFHNEISSSQFFPDVTPEMAAEVL